MDIPYINSIIAKTAEMDDKTITTILTVSK